MAINVGSINGFAINSSAGASDLFWPVVPLDVVFVPFSLEAGIQIVLPITSLHTEFVAPSVQVSFDVPPPVLETEMLAGSVSAGLSITMPGPFEVEVGIVEGAIPTLAADVFSHTIEQRILGESGVVRIWITNDVVAYGSFSHQIEQEIGTFGKIFHTVEQEIYQYGSFSSGIQQQIYDADDFGAVASGSHTLWTAFVTLGGVDVSDRLTGIVRVEAEEGTSRTAEVTLRPKPIAEKSLIPVVLASWVKQPITIDYATLNDDGSVRSQVRIFTGIVDEPVYDPTTRLVTFNCIDNMIVELENMSREAIDSLTSGARWTELVFDEDVDNYEYARDRMSTTPYALDKDRVGVYHWTPWLSKVTPDFSFASGDIIDESLGVDIQPGRELINKIDIDFGYRYDRKRQRKAKFDWNFPSSFCEYLGVGLTGTWTIPNVQMIVDAAEGTGWCLETMATQKLPPSQWVNCDNQLVGWLVTGAQRDSLALRARGTLTKRFLQSISEKYLLAVQASTSIAAFGVLKEEMTQNVLAKADLAPWEQDLECCEPQINQSSFGGTSDAWETWEDIDAAPLIETGTRDDMEYAIETLIAQARTRILDSHRENRVSFDVPLHPLIDRYQTIQIDTDTVDARGKVFHILHVLDFSAGSAITSVQLAISVAGDGVGVDTPIEAPEKPDTTTRLAMLAGTQNIISATTRYGGIAFDTNSVRNELNMVSRPDPEFPQSGDQPLPTGFGPQPPSPVGGSIPDGLCLGETPEPWLGYVGNKVPPDVGSIQYAERFVLSTEAIDEDDRMEEEAETGHEYEVAVPNDFLALAA